VCVGVCVMLLSVSMCMYACIGYLCVCVRKVCVWVCG